MKKLLIILLTMLPLTGIKVFAQSVAASNQPSISKTEILGVWQINSPRVGNGFSECFSFYSDGKFLYQYDPSDDTRIITTLKGKYRLDNNRLFFTITSRIERVGGKIVTGAAGTDDYLFAYDNNATKETIEKMPKELDPLFILKINKNANKIDFFINNRHYYKVSADPNKVKDQ